MTSSTPGWPASMLGATPVAVSPSREPTVGAPAIPAFAGVRDFLKYNTRTYNFLRRRVIQSMPNTAPNFSDDVAVDKYGVQTEGRVDGALEASPRLASSSNR